ncbi:MAG TPA: alpha/beta hydrolase [Actinomycetota bacterium]
MPTAQAGEITIGYDVHGKDGDWLVLVMGHAYARWAWNWQVSGLAERFRVVTFDNRGIGETGAPPAPYTVEQMAADTVALLDALGIERAHLIGTSLGGCIALEVALSYPERVERLVLACTSLGGASPKSYPLMPAVVRIIEEAANEPAEVRLRRGTENAFAPGFVAEHPEVIDQVLALRDATGQPLEAWLAQATAYPAYDATDRVASLATETLVVTGDQDNVIDARNSRVLAEMIPNASLIEMDGGHLFFIEQPERFNDLAARFLAGGRTAVEARG